MRFVGFFQDTPKPGDRDFRDAIAPCPRAGTVCGASNCFRVHRRSPPAGSTETKVCANCTKLRLRLVWFFLNRQLRLDLLAFSKTRDFKMIGNPEVVVVAARENSLVPHGT